MGKSLNILLGAVATSLITAGVAAQTGAVRWPQLDQAGSGGVQAQQAKQSPTPTPSPSPSSEPSPSPSPSPTQAPPPPAGPPPHKKHH